MNEIGERTLLEEINSRIPAADFEATYFPGGMVRVSMDITAEMVEQIEAVAKEQHLSRGEALVAVLALGLGVLNEQKARQLIEQSDPVARDELDLLVRRMRQMEVQYAVMKRRTWDFLKAYQAACLADGALRTQIGGLQALLAPLRAERDALRERVRQLEAEMARLQQIAELPSVCPAHTSPCRWWQHLLRRLRLRAG